MSRTWPLAQKEPQPTSSNDCAASAEQYDKARQETIQTYESQRQTTQEQYDKELADIETQHADAIRQDVAMGVAEIDLALCYSYNNWSCGACFRACPFPGVAMKIGLWERPEVVADACVGCGSCERACIRYPHAIRVRPHEGHA